MEVTEANGQGPEPPDDRLAVQSAVARVLAEAGTVPDATRRMLVTIGATLGWRLGAVWDVDPDGEHIRCVESWHADGMRAEPFEEASREVAFEPGVGLPGRVWADAQPAWIADVTTDANFPRARVAAECDVHGAFAFPIRSVRGVIGVVEFFTEAVAEPDAYLLDLMVTIGHQLGQHIERIRAEGAVRASEARKTAMLEASLDCIVSMDHLGRVVEFNTAAEQTFGYSADEALGREMAELIIPPGLRARHRAGLKRYLETGEANVLGRRIEITGMRADGSEFPVELAITRIGLDRPPTFTGFIRDISERKRREELDRFLVAAGALLGASLDYEEALESVTRLAVPAIADWCVIDVLEEDGSVRRVAVEHVDPDKLELARELARSLDDPFGLGKVIRTGEPEHFAQVPPEAIAELTPDPRHRAALESLGFRSSVIVPLRSGGGGTLGGLALISGESGRQFDERDVGFASELGRRCAGAIENARLYRERSRIAHTLQQSLLPPELPTIPGVSVEPRFRPAGQGIEMGGDFYDVFPVGPDTWALTIGDVCGKGPDAAALTALARYTLRAVTMHEERPDRVLSELNEAILRQRSDGRFCSAVLAMLQHRDSGVSMEIASGGHPPPLVLRADGTVEATGGSGLLLGLWTDPEVSSERVDLVPGDSLILYTDGVTDAGAPDRILTPGALARLVRSCVGMSTHAIADRIETAVMGPVEAARDDIAVLVVGVDASPVASGEGLRVELQRRPEAPSEARQAIAGMADAIQAAALEELKLLASELVTNSCRHAVAGDEPIALELEVEGDVVRLSVTDAGQGFEPEVQRFDLDSESGRGLFIVDALADRWGVERSGGTRVWAELDTSADRPEL